MGGAPFATKDDLKAMWPKYPGPEMDDYVDVWLGQAAVYIRGKYRTIDARIAAGKLDPEAPKIVSCNMVRRYMDSQEFRDDLSQGSWGAGPFTFQGSFRSTGGMWFSKTDADILGGEGDVVGTIGVVDTRGESII